MVNNCSVRGCQRTRKLDSSLKLHTLPKNEKYRDVWIAFCDSPKPIAKTGAICSAHFEDRYKYKSPLDLAYGLTSQRTRNLTADAIPTLNGPFILPHTPMEVKTVEPTATEPETGSELLPHEPMDTEAAVTSSLSSELLPHEPMDTEAAVTSSLSSCSKTDCSLESPDIVSKACQSEWDLLKAANENLILEKCMAQMNAEKLKVSFQAVVEENTNLQKRNEELEKEKQEMQKLLKKLQQQQQAMKKENERLKSELNSSKDENKKYEAILNQYFSPGQLRRLLSETSNKRLRWCNEDIASAISLRCASIKGYRYLKYKRFWPLPHVRTLRRWAQKVVIEEGIMETVFSLMEQKGKAMSQTERLIALSYDEMSVSPFYCYDRATDTVFGEVNKVQVVMARGLTTRWKQPIAYFFDKDMTKDVLFEILKSLYEIDFTVVSVTSDLGGSNRSFLKQLQITNEYVYFNHPSDESLKVFCFADAPHLIKLARNHFLDEGYLLKGTEVRRDVIEKLLQVSQKEITVVHRLSQVTHLDVVGNARQRVRPAAQLMSNTTALSIDHCCKKGYISVRNHKVVCEVFNAIGSFFKIFNNLDKTNKLNETFAYGLAIENQEKELDGIKEVIENMRQIKVLRSGKNTEALLPFQKGLLMSIKSLKEMYLYLRGKYNLEYILTQRLNQDSLENFFGYIRGMGGQNDHPLPTDFKWRMKLYILGKHHSAIFTNNRNTEETVDEECLITPTRSFACSAPVTTTPEQHLQATLRTPTTPCRTPTPANTFTPPHQTFKTAVTAHPSSEAVTLYSIDGKTAVLNTEDENIVTCYDDLLLEELRRIEEDVDTIAEEDEKTEVVEEENQTEEGNEESKDTEESNREDEDAVDQIWSTLNKDPARPEEKLQTEGFEYLAGYVAHRYRGKYSHLGKKTSESEAPDDDDWIQLISKGSLIRPTPEFVDVLEFVEATFLSVHGTDKRYMKKGGNAIADILQKSIKKLKEKFSYDKLTLYPKEVIQCFIRVRTFIRIRNCNERMKEENMRKTNAKKLNNKNNKLGSVRKTDPKTSEMKKNEQPRSPKKLCVSVNRTQS